MSWGNIVQSSRENEMGAKIPRKSQLKSNDKNRKKIGTLPMVVMVSVVYGALHLRRSGKKLEESNLAARLGGLLSRLTGWMKSSDSKITSDSNSNWRKANPGEMAARAAAARYEGKSGPKGQSSKGKPSNPKKKGGKKKGKRKH